MRLHENQGNEPSTALAALCTESCSLIEASCRKESVRTTFCVIVVVASMCMKKSWPYERLQGLCSRAHVGNTTVVEVRQETNARTKETQNSLRFANLQEILA